MEYAIETLTSILLSAGMSGNDANHLLARFLEEEAFDYVDCIRSVSDEDAVYEGNSGLIS